MIISHGVPREVRNSIRNILTDEFSTSEIADYCEVSNSTINELKNGKRKIEASSFELAMNLYRFAMLHEVNDDNIRMEELKGKNCFIEPSFEVSKLFVAFNPQDLIPYGAMNVYEKKYDFPKNQDQLERLYLSDAVFVKPSGKMINCRDLGYSFKCRYAGTGPSNLVRFLSNYSRMSEEELQEVIYYSSVIEYDFKNDTIRGLPAAFSEGSIEAFSLQGKLEIILDEYDNNPSIIRGRKSEIQTAAQSVKKLAVMMKEQYRLKSNLQYIHYYPDQDDFSEHYTASVVSQHREINIILEFPEYDICIPYKIDQEKGDVFKSLEMTALLEGLGLEYNPEKAGVFRSTFESLKPIRGKQSFQVDIQL